MKTLESAVMKGDKVIPCKYYEIESVCQKIVEDYCALSKENADYFQMFAQDYGYCKPYFDFVVTELNYQILNPELEEGKILMGKDKHMYIYDATTKKVDQGFHFGLSSNSNLNIYPMPMDSSYFEDCLIDKDINHILPKDCFGHVHILQQFLNLLLISNKEVCEEYQKEQVEIGAFVQRHLPFIRFQADFQGRYMITKCLYREGNVSDKQKEFMDLLLSNRYTYPSFLYKTEEYDTYSKADDLSDTLRYDIENTRKR